MLLKILTSFDDIVGQRVHHRMVQMGTHHDAQTVNFLGIRRHRVGGKHPATFPHFVRHIEFVEVLELFVEREGDNGNALGFVHTDKVARVDQSLAQLNRVVERVAHDLRIAIESAPYHHVGMYR